MTSTRSWRARLMSSKRFSSKSAAPRGPAYSTRQHHNLVQHAAKQPSLQRYNALTSNRDRLLRVCQLGSLAKCAARTAITTAILRPPSSVATVVRRSTIDAPSAAGTIPLSSSFVVSAAHSFTWVPLRRLELRLDGSHRL